MNSSFNKVVQYHRRLRHIAPGSFFGKFIGAGRNSRGTATNHWRLVESQPNWTAAKRAFPAAWLPLILAAGIVVVPSGMGGIRVSQTAGARPGTVASFCRKSNRADCSRRDSRPVRQKTLYH